MLQKFDVFRERSDIPIFQLSDSEYEAFKCNTIEILKTLNAKNLYEAAIKIIFGETFAIPFRHLYAVVVAQENHLDELIEAIKLIDSYNDFEGERVAEFIKQNKDLFYEVGFGREGSPVLYISLKGEYKNRKRELKKLLQTLTPDELDEDEFGKIRVWWD